MFSDVNMSGFYLTNEIIDRLEKAKCHHRMFFSFLL